MKNIGNLFVRLFVISLLSVNISLFFHNCFLFRSRSRPVFFYGSGSEQTVSAAPAPAPTKMCRLRRFRLRLRIPGHHPSSGCLRLWELEAYIQIHEVFLFPTVLKRETERLDNFTTSCRFVYLLLLCLLHQNYDSRPLPSPDQNEPVSKQA